MLFITTLDKFREMFPPDESYYPKSNDGYFLIIKEEESPIVRLCDFAIVLNGVVAYYSNFTRLFFKLNPDVGLELLKRTIKNYDLIPNGKYFKVFTQVTSDESYYKLRNKHGRFRAKKILLIISDIGYIYYRHGVVDDLIKEELLWHSRAKYAFMNGIKYIFSPGDREFIKMTELKRLTIPAEYIKGKAIDLKFHHNIIGFMPINVFIGKNGTGKSYAIKRTVEKFIRGGNESLSTNINKVVVVSNTLDDKYPSTFSNLNRAKSRDIDGVYEYFSMIKRKRFTTAEGVERITLKNQLNELIYREMQSELPFSIVDIFEDLLHKNIGCYVEVVDAHGDLFRGVSQFLKKSSFKGDEIKIKEAFFIQEEEKMEMSSGQNNFINIILCILISIQNNTLIFIDELENFLHPNFISQAMRMLKDCLVKTNSICVIATHSLHIAREIPRQGVSVFERCKDLSEVLTYTPEMESYSCDLQTISNYIFNTKEEGSLFDDNLKDIAKKFRSKREVFEEFRGKISNEIILSITDRVYED